MENTNDHISNKKLEKIGKIIRLICTAQHLLRINKNKIFFADHSSGHAAWAYYSNKETNKKKFLVLTLDAFGDFINYSVFQFKNHNSIKRITKGGNSIIARLYRYTTLLLGFKPDEHEYKIMGIVHMLKKIIMMNF